MFVRKTHTTINGKTYTNHLLVESVRTPRGPRQRTVCSLGSLAGRSADEWLKLAVRIEDALAGQRDLFENPNDPEVRGIIDAARHRHEAVSAPKPKPSHSDPGSIKVQSDRIEIEEPREAGPVYVGTTMYDRIGIGRVLAEQGLAPITCMLIRVMVMNRLVFPGSEHAMPDWVNRSALADLLNVDFSRLNHTRLYRTMDRLYERREGIERAIRERECTLFNLDDTVFFYDLTSDCCEGECPRNPQAKRGYSRDSRPDCKQVVVGLVVDREGFPIVHEVFDGNRRDNTTVDAMLDNLSGRTVIAPGATVVVDRGMSTDDNIASIKARGCHYIVAARQSERDRWLEELGDESLFVEIKRTPSPRNPFQKKSIVQVKRVGSGSDATFILCKSDGRVQKDRSIRLRFEEQLKKDTQKLAKRIESGKLTALEKIHEAIGRIKERYPRVARYYELIYDSEAMRLSVTEIKDRKRKAELLDGSYILKTDREDLNDEQVWRTYMLLTRAENAFRSMKSPLWERPIFHHLERRVQTHIFLCVLAYHLLVAIEKYFLDANEHTSWESIREALSTHQIATIVIPCSDGRILRIRRSTKPEESHRKIYRILGMSPDMVVPKKTWSENENVVT